MFIYKDLDKTFEHRKNLEKIIYWPLAIILTSNIFYGLAKKLLKKSSTASTVKKHATTHIALETVYNFNHKINLENGFLSGLLNFSIQKYSGNAKALRNRLKLVKKILRKEIDKINKNNITILNLGAGSARSVVEVVIEKKNKKFNLFFLDTSKSALEASRKKVVDSNIKHNVKYVQENISNIKKIFIDLSPDIVEMVGILDYYNEEKSIKVLNDVYDTLKKKGVFITGNILPNKEEPFLTKLLNWPLIYMSLEELKTIIKKSKFSNKKAQIIYEPMEIHSVLVLHK